MFNVLLCNSTCKHTLAMVYTHIYIYIKINDPKCIRTEKEAHGASVGNATALCAQDR